MLGVVTNPKLRINIDLGFAVVLAFSLVVGGPTVENGGGTLRPIPM